ncbi:S49 family peptidase [Duganella sp. FT92W]|uniref:S49 family peptidase n=1 Tax=Pseudoduganella rivuli TaxID=2666085 RepID=A0A7X2LSA2_9BURK|nr:S49 family peptidase [Pseudoduganella rivuli]MRV70589.1 S49 family peptidase [Pseudoduganella rivuli]
MRFTRNFAARRNSSSSPGIGGTEQLSQLIAELSAQRISLEQDRKQFAADRRAERRWRMGLRFVLFVLPALFGAVLLASTLGLRLGPLGKVAGVVHIDGEIAPGTNASADKVIPALEMAFESDNVTQVVLAIDSPGGAPVESERINSAIASLRARHPKRVTAVINNVGASAAYMIALHADTIVAGKYSLVGSIGAIIAPWQLDQAMSKVGITQRVYSSGKLKAFLNPFTPVTHDADAKAQELVNRIGYTFIEELHHQRAGKLKPGVDFSTGEVWSGQDAKELGLVDAVGTIDNLTLGDGIKAYNLGPHRDMMSVLGGAANLLYQQSVFGIKAQALTLR